MRYFRWYGILPLTLCAWLPVVILQSTNQTSHTTDVTISTNQTSHAIDVTTSTNQTPHATDVTTSTNQTSQTTDVTTSANTESETSPSAACSVEANINGEGFQQALLMGSQMLYLLFSFNNDRNLTPIDIDTPQPLTWVHVTGNHGKGLLWLRQDFEFFSLSTLSFDVDHLEVQLQETPSGCLSSRSSREISEDVRDFILNDFSGFDVNVSWTGGEICNARFRLIDTGVEVYFLCCSKDEFLNTNCYELERNIWMNIFLMCLLIFPLIALMYAPLMIPYDLFRDSREDIYYQHKLNSSLKIRVSKTADNMYEDQNDLKLSENTVHEMPKFSKTLRKLENQKTYDCSLEKIHFYVSREDIIGQNADPFGPFTMLYDALARYDLKRRGICDGTTLREHLSVWAGKLLNTAYLLLIIFLVNIPVILRAIKFIYHNEPEWYITTSVAQLGLQVNLLQSISYGVSLIPRTELYMIYAVLIGVYVVAQVFAIKGTHQVDFVLEILKQCLRDSRKRRIKQAFEKIYRALRALLWKKRPVEYLLAPLYFILFLPGVMISFLFYLLPTVNLFFSVPIYFFTFILSNKCGCLSRTSCVSSLAKTISVWLGLNYLYIKPDEEDDDDDDARIRCWSMDIVIIAILIFSLPVILFIVLDSLVFYIDIFIYLLVGLLLNASRTTTYLIIFLMLALYVRDLFDGVTNRYIKFINTIIAEAINKTKDEVYSVSLQNENIQKNTAFQVDDDKPISQVNVQPISIQSTPTIRLAREDDYLKWKVQRLLLFLDKKDTPYIPKSFFLKACNMDTVGAPGTLNQNLLDVFNSIVRIVVFLIFILLVVLAFGDVSETLGTNQTLTAIAGGLIPWLFRKFLHAPTEMGVDVDNLHYKEVMNDLIRNYEQAWTVADIEISDVVAYTGTSLVEKHSEDLTADSIKPPVSDKDIECIEMSDLNSANEITEQISSLGHLVIFLQNNKKTKLTT